MEPEPHRPHRPRLDRPTQRSASALLERPFRHRSLSGRSAPLEQTLSSRHFPVDRNPLDGYSQSNGETESPHSRHCVARLRGRLAPPPGLDPLLPNYNRVTPFPRNYMNMISWVAQYFLWNLDASGQPPSSSSFSGGVVLGRNKP